MNIDRVLEPYRHLYHNNAYFRAGADVAIQMLGATFAGLAIDAEEQQRKNDELMHYIRNQPPVRIWTLEELGVKES